MRVEIVSDHPSMVALDVHYIRVHVEGHPSVLTRLGADGWLYIAPDGSPKHAPTQQQAVERALGITIPNWRF